MSQKLSCGQRRRKRGSALIEMAFVGIPLIFILISIFEVSRGMWLYHTLAYSTKSWVRYATVHGVDCVPNAPAIYNSCSQTAAQILTFNTSPAVIQGGPGLNPTTTMVTFTSDAGNIGPVALGTCAAGGGGCGAVWPPNDGRSNDVGETIKITVYTPFNSAIAMFWPGAKPVSFASGNLPASSQDVIKF